MNPPHVIQLRFPWQREQLPGSRVVYRRHFHRPTGLGGRERVQLVLDGVAAGAELAVNKRRLADPREDSREYRVDVTPLLDRRNLIEITISEDSLGHPPGSAAHAKTQPPCVVRLEIWPAPPSQRNSS